MSSQWKNHFIRLFFSAPKKQAPIPPHPKRVLIVSTTGLGDSLWATPAIAALKEAHPACEILILASPLAKQVFANNPHITSCVCFEKPYFLSFFRCLSQLKKLSFDCIFIFHSSQRLIFPLCASLKSPHIVGTAKINKGLDILFTKLYPQKPIHEAQRRLDLVSYLGASSAARPLAFYGIEKKKLSSFSILLHPGAKDLYKCWPISCYQELAQLLEKKGVALYASGTPDEQDLLQAIKKAAPTTRFVKPGSLQSLAKHMAQMDLIITNDTGPMHLAVALQLPVITLFAPTDAKLCGPFHAKHAILMQGKRTCTPCLQRKCREPFCLLQISAHDVLQQVEQIHALSQS